MGDKQGEGAKVDSQVSGIKWVNNDGMSTVTVCVVLLDSSGSGNVAEVGKGRLSWR